jgi:mannose-6-phosphate isomerase-like protein (cupin superfamily)
MPYVSPEDARVFSLHGVEFTGLAAPSRGTRENAAWRVSIGPGTPATPHRLTREEILVAISGKARAIIGDAEFDVVAGGAIIVPAETDFSLANPHAAPFEAVAILPVGGQARIGAEAPFTLPWAV